MPTIFDASLAEQKKKQQVVEEKLAKMTEKKQSEKDGQKPEKMTSETVESVATVNTTASKKKTDETTAPRRKPEEYSSVLREEKPNNGLFAAFMPQPKGVCFESQHEKEQILLVLRQHPVVNVVWIIIAFVLAFAPFLLFPMIPLQVILPGNFLFFLMLAWYLFVTAYVIESFLGWYFNIYIITDERIIDIDFYSLIYKSVSEAKIERIEDVTATTAGFFGAFFNFGNVTVQTAAEKREFDFSRVPQTAKVTKFLNELILEEEREKIEGRVM